MIKTATQFALIMALLAAGSAQVVDRMVAVVNRQVILESEWDEAARIEFLQQGKPLDQLNAGEMDAVQDHLIDQSLVRQQIVNSSVVDPTVDEISSHIRKLRDQIPGAATDEKWQAILASYGLTEQDMTIHAALELRVLKFLDLRFRTLARADRAGIDDYYKKTLAPQLRKQGAPVPPEDQVAEKIRDILTERRMTELQTEWLKDLHAQSHIEKLACDSCDMRSTIGARGIDLWAFLPMTRWSGVKP